jgi:hypothetical protein
MESDELEPGMLTVVAVKLVFNYVDVMDAAAIIDQYPQYRASRSVLVQEMRLFQKGVMEMLRDEYEQAERRLGGVQ